MKFHKIGLIIILSALCLTGCKGEKNIEEEVKEVVVIEEEPIVESEELVIEGQPSPISGIYGPEEKLNRRIVGVMFDNHPRARWQSGLKDAEIIYEFEVEAPYTRYLGFFLLNDPEDIGPVRSARPYFITKVLEFDSLYVHAGGSEVALAEVKKLGLADIDSISSSAKVFWRKSHKKMPNNLYTGMEAIRATGKERGYKELGDEISFLFYSDDTNIKGKIAHEIKINYNKTNSTEYIYNGEEGVYYRFKDGKEHIEESDGSQIKSKNIIIQEANTHVIDNVGRLAVDLVGSGQGRYFSNGIEKKIKWVKDSRKGKTIYYNESGQELYLNPGVTWVQMVRPTTEVIVN